jgi:hypothetical protein
LDARRRMLRGRSEKRWINYIEEDVKMKMKVSEY